MKLLTILLVLGMTGSVYANDAGTAFVTGFANALTVKMGGVPYSQPSNTESVVVYQPNYYHTSRHYDVTNNGFKGGMYFPDMESCLTYLRNTNSGYTDCIIVY